MVKEQLLEIIDFCFVVPAVAIEKFGGNPDAVIIDFFGKNNFVPDSGLTPGGKNSLGCMVETYLAPVTVPWMTFAPGLDVSCTVSDNQFGNSSGIFVLIYPGTVEVQRRSGGSQHHQHYDG